MTKVTRVAEKKDCRQEFFDKFNKEFFTQLKNGTPQLEIFGKRPQERWLYGFIGQALSKVLAKDNKAYVLTEVPVARTGKPTPGRVDFIFEFNGHLFLMEVKASYFSYPKVDDRLDGLRKIWVDAKGQLEEIDLNANSKFTQLSKTGRCIKFPLLFVVCGKTGNEENLNEIEVKSHDVSQFMSAIETELGAEFGASCLNNRKAFRHISEEKFRREFGWLLFAGMKKQKTVAK